LRNSGQFSCSPSWPYFESECDGLSSDLWYFQISFEPLTSTLHGIDHASDIVGSVSNQAQQLLRRLYSRDECGTKTYQIFSWFPRDRTSSQIAIILVQSYGISRSHLNHRRQNVMVKLQTYGISRPHLNYRRQLLRWLHSRDRCDTKHIRHSLAVPRDRTSSQIAIILVQSYGISRSHMNHRRQSLRRLHSRDGCGKITYQTFSFFPSSMFEESECDGLSSDLRYLQITFGPPNVNVTRHRSCSKSQEFLDQVMFSISWFAQQ